MNERERRVKESASRRTQGAFCLCLPLSKGQEGTKKERDRPDPPVEFFFSLFLFISFLSFLHASRNRKGRKGSNRRNARLGDESNRPNTHQKRRFDSIARFPRRVSILEKIVSKSKQKL